MSIKITPEDGTGQIIWETDNENVLTVDDKGTVYAVGNGKAKVIAKTIDESVEASFEVTVYTPATSIVLSKQTATIFTGDTLQLVGNVLPEDASNTQITWSSENEGVAIVNRRRPCYSNSSRQGKHCSKHRRNKSNMPRYSYGKRCILDN